MRLIDADAIIDDYCGGCPMGVRVFCMKSPVCVYAELVSNAPTVDAAPVVQCSECVYHHDCGTHFCDRLGMDLDDLNFSCSYGKRRRDEHH